MPDELSKYDYLLHLHEALDRPSEAIRASGGSVQDKAKQINALVAEQRAQLVASIANMPAEARGRAALIIQYAITIVGLEYRNRVWPYEYMAFSRRVGELWEAFCSTAWTYPVHTGVERMPAPSFNNVRSAILSRLRVNLTGHAQVDAVMNDVNALTQLVGDINMNEDEVFTRDGVPHVIDFKSGFGSNEKGNMLRLMTVGHAYRAWNPETRLMLLVRQEQNNNYLAVMKRSSLWEVHTGSDAYGKIEELTGSDITYVRNNVLAWDDDFSPEFLESIMQQPGNLMAYLRW